MSGRWNGVLRVGFSAHDPSNMAGLPNYACPGKTNFQMMLDTRCSKTLLSVSRFKI